MTGPTVRAEARMDEPLDGTVRNMLRDLNAGFPRVETMTAPEARAAIAQRRLPVTNIDDVRRTIDHSVAGPGGAIPVRIYYPHGELFNSRPGIVFASNAWKESRPRSSRGRSCGQPLSYRCPRRQDSSSCPDIRREALYIG